MKKLSLLVGGIILSGVALAQKPSSDVPMTLEGQLAITAPTAGTTVQFAAPSVRFRYFLTDNIAARVTLGITSGSNTSYVYETPGDLSSATGEIKTTNSNFNAAIGAEYHFAGTDRLSPYIGLDVIFGAQKNKYERTDAAGGIGTEVYSAGSSADIETPTSLFGVGLALGADYYFAENFYFGLEMGMSWANINFKSGSADVTTVAGGTTTTTSGDARPESKAGQFFTGSLPNNVGVASLAPTGNFRLGWRF